MEKIIRTTLAAFAALTAFAGCRNVEQELPAPVSVKTVQFHAGTADTRTAFTEAVDGVYQTLWTEHDSEVLLSLNYGKAEASAVTASADGKTASFAASFDATEAKSPYSFYAVSPASAARAISPSRSAWSVYIAAEQTPSALSVDEGAQLLVAKSAASATLPDDVNLHFSHLTAYGRIALKNLVLGDAVVRKAELVFSTPVVGEWYWGEDGTLTPNGDSHTITLHTDASGDLWFACAPVDVSGATMTLTLYTDQGSMTRAITFPEGRRFSSGQVARFSVDMAGVEIQTVEAFYAVLDESTLRAGDKLLIVNTSGTFALGEQISWGMVHRLGMPVQVADGRIADPGKATVLTLGEGSVADSWSFHTGSGYLSAAGDDGALTESGEVDGFSSWKVKVTDGGPTLVISKGDMTKVIYYSSSVFGFSCSMSSSSDELVTLYRLGGSPASVGEEDPLTKHDEYGCYMTGSERTYVKGSDQFNRSYDRNGTLVFVLLNAAEKEQLEISGYDPASVKGDEVTVTVNWRKGLVSSMKGETFRLRVVKEDGSKIWLGDGSGQGFILKK